MFCFSVQMKLCVPEGLSLSLFSFSLIQIVESGHHSNTIQTPSFSQERHENSTASYSGRQHFHGFKPKVTGFFFDSITWSLQNWLLENVFSASRVLLAAFLDYSVIVVLWSIKTLGKIWHDGQAYGTTFQSYPANVKQVSFYHTHSHTAHVWHSLAVSGPLSGRSQSAALCLLTVKGLIDLLHWTLAAAGITG